MQYPPGNFGSGPLDAPGSTLIVFSSVDSVPSVAKKGF
jgi:hypothetical protein